MKYIKKMFANDFNQEEVITSHNELVEFLKKRPEFGSNHFILTFEENGFPQLSFFVKQDKSIIYFLDIDKSFISLNGTMTRETTMFYENIAGSEVELPNKSIIAIEKAEETAIEFFNKQEQPTTIEWLEI